MDRSDTKTEDAVNARMVPYGVYVAGVVLLFPTRPIASELHPKDILATLAPLPPT